MNKLESALFTSAVNYLSTYINNEKRHVIEPLTCMIRLAMLSFKPEGTKLCVYDNSIYIQEPSVLQGPIRWLGGDNRNDIHFLLEPINKALLRYDITGNDSIKNIYKLAIKGLNRLKKSYSKSGARVEDSSLTTHSLDLYINQIQEALDGKKKPDDDEDEAISNTYKTLGTLWTDGQIDIINNLFLEAESRSDSESYLRAIENIINSKVKASKEILVKNMYRMI